MKPLTQLWFLLRVLWSFRFHLLGAAVMLAFWESWAARPFRMFVVLVHETCHAAASLLTGGEVLEMHTALDESGHTLSRGGYFPLIASAGYVGSALLGALLIYTGSRPRLQRLLLLAVGAACMGMTMWFTPVGGPDFYLGIIGGLVLVCFAIKSQRAAIAAATWMGILLCLYSLYDFRTDLWTHPELTDAGILARYWGEPLLAYPIALAWVLLSLTAMYRAMRALVRERMFIEVENSQAMQ